MFGDHYSLGDRQGLNRGANEVPMMNQKQDSWPNFSTFCYHIPLNDSKFITDNYQFRSKYSKSFLTTPSALDELPVGTDKELIAQNSRIPSNSEENYIHELIHSLWMNQNENLNEN